MNDQEREQERRKQKALERLGTNNPICVLCGENNWRCLELHHIAGKAFDDTLTIVCRNCHRKLSDRQKDYPQHIGALSDPLTCVGHFLLGLADLLELLIVKLRDFGQLLTNQNAVATTAAEVSP